MTEPRTIRVLNLGAGVQSTAMFLLSIRQDEPEYIPRFDFAVFADTQEEPRSVYNHIEWLKSLGGPPILMDSAGKLGDNLISGFDLSGSRFVSIPLFLKVEGQEREGRSKRQCTRDYKIRPIEKVVRRQILGLRPKQHIPKNVVIEQYIGLTHDEAGRVARTKARYQDKPGFEGKFPLFDMEWSRGDCAAYLREVAPERKIVKSACVFCPFHDNATWRDMRDNDPESWARALEIDRAIRDHGSRCAQDLKSTAYLHRSCLPLDQAPIDLDESKRERVAFGFEQDCEGMCGL